MDLQTISVLASGVFFIATYLIVQPLKLSINALQVSVDRLAQTMEKVRVEVADNNEELARNEEKLKTLFTNTSTLEWRIRHIEERCENCQCREPK